ncbi:MAG: LptE family protein [Planctomycetota bacterium]|nr:LptE family protein [Planctomycetota bacterium]
MKNRHSSIVMATQRATLGVLLAFTGLLLSTGCRGYQFGNRAIFRPDIRTVHVPIFENETFRQTLGQRLTESVIREIQSRTPYQLADRSSADSVLQGRILSEQKRVLGENQFDEPRDLQIEFLIEVNWATRDGTPLMQRFTLNTTDTASFIPEAGQSMVSAQQQLIDELASSIVNQMESGW